MDQGRKINLNKEEADYKSLSYKNPMHMFQYDI